MHKWTCYLWLSTCLALVTLMAMTCNAAPKISESNARKHAMACVEAVGWQHKGLTKAVVRSLPGSPQSWELSDEDAIVVVDGETGQVRSVVNRRAVAARAGKSVNLTEQRANQLANGYLRDMELADASAEVESSKPERDNPEAQPNRWAVRFRRMYGGYPFYRNDFMLVTLDPDNGSLESLGANFRSPLPPTTEVSVGRDSATAAAQDYLAGIGVEAGESVSVELMIVQPDDYWEYREAGATPPRPTTSRLAWVVQLNGPWAITEVWIDAANGAALGGVATTGEARSAKAPKWPAIKPVQSVSLQEVGASKHSTFASDSGKVKSFLEALQALHPTDFSQCDPSIYVTLKGSERVYRMGYSSKDHKLFLIEKTRAGLSIQGHRAMETSAQFEQLLAGLISQ